VQEQLIKSEASNIDVQKKEKLLQEERAKISNLTNELGELRTGNQCLNCNKYGRDSVVLPCLHLAYCKNCSVKLDHCTICQAKVCGFITTKSPMHK